MPKFTLGDDGKVYLREAETQAREMLRGVPLPPRFIRDCLESDCDVGDYRGGKLYASPAQLAELKSRASHYADDGIDAAPPGLVNAARALLRAIAKTETGL